ncbi:MAG: hypothetical protein ABIO79_13645 [Ferruginibacter sp.]
MKKMIKPFKIILPLLILLQVNVFAQNDNDNNDNGKKKYAFVKTKSVNKTYHVSSTDKLNIDNSFGKVEIHTWDKNEIKVDVRIEVSANSESLAQKMIDRISVSDEKNSKGISFETKMKDVNNNKEEKSSMSIDYSIYMPAGNPLHVENEFGATIIPDHRGEVELVSKFGSLTAGNLSNVKSIQVEFGRAKIESVNNGNLVIKYSNSTLGKLSGNIKMNVEFSTNVIMNLDNSLSGLDAKASYSSLNLKPSPDMSASYTINTSFGSFKNRTAVKFDGDDDKDERSPKFDYKYSGRSGSGNIQIKVNTSFGNVILGEPGPNDMKDKNKSKNKSRTS